MRRIITALALTTVVAIATACTSGPSFRAYLNELANAAGVGGQDCGVVAYGQPRAQAIECAAAALKVHRPVWVAFQVLGIDSQIYMGLAVNSAGQAWRITWGSDSSGGAPLIASRVMDREICSLPEVANRAEGQGGPIACTP
jgi:hypothetical protein